MLMLVPLIILRGHILTTRLIYSIKCRRDIRNKYYVNLLSIGIEIIIKLIKIILLLSVHLYLCRPDISRIINLS